MNDTTAESLVDVHNHLLVKIKRMKRHMSLVKYY